MARRRRKRKLKDILKDPRVEDAWGEQKESESDEGNYWADLAPGYISSLGTTMLHELSLDKLFDALDCVEKG